MKLSIITINRNNAAGLQKTIDSVRNQIGLDGHEVEHIIVDGASTDGSVDVIKEYESCIVHCQVSISLKWLSEPDKGIYNAMNKGIEIALGLRVVDSLNRSESSPHYIQILNSGDILAAPDVCARMAQAVKNNDYPGILYGNMIRQGQKLQRDTCLGGQHIWTMDDFIRGTINHDPTYIRRDLYEKYGLYDEALKICSDWKWFVNAVIFEGEKPIYTPIDVTIFDVTGISETNLAFREEERHRELEKLLPAAILKDYDDYHFLHTQYHRLKKYHLWGMVYFVERVLFKLEKWGIFKA